MKTSNEFISTITLGALLFFSSCSKQPEIDALFHNVLENKQTTFSYNNEIFTAVISSPKNNARITLRGDKGTEITVHDALYSYNRITSNTTKNPEKIIEGLIVVK